jgi:hypothetical protein
MAWFLGSYGRRYYKSTFIGYEPSALSPIDSPALSIRQVCLRLAAQS